MFFTGHHVLYAPWGRYAPDVATKQLTVNRLCHDTHDCYVQKIQQDQLCVFKPKKKKGKSSGRRSFVPCDPHYEDIPSSYYEVNDKECLIPGYYSWWSPLEVESTSDSSFFGNRRFSIGFDDMIECYKSSYDPPLEEVYFRCGGTLRHVNQACKMIIVCPAPARCKLPEAKYPSMTYDSKTKIQLTFECPSRAPGCYDTYAFAFYFPSKKCQLKCPQQMISFTTVGHPICIKHPCPSWQQNTTSDQSSSSEEEDEEEEEDKKEEEEEEEEEEDEGEEGKDEEELVPESERNLQQNCEMFDNIALSANPYSLDKEPKTPEETQEEIEMPVNTLTAQTQHPVLDERTGTPPGPAGVLQCRDKVEYEEATEDEEEEPPKKKIAKTVDDETLMLL